MVSRTQTRTIGGRLAAAIALTAAATLVLTAAPAVAGNGGIGAPQPPAPTVAGPKAKLVDGLARAPSSAPARVKAVIAAANRIAKGHGYCNGGGYSSWRSTCYDCSSSVSFALHGGRLIAQPMPPTSLEGWGRSGAGKWITVYANSGHAFMTIAGLRFDTADTPGGGPGWAKTMGYENPKSFTIRHRAGL